MFAIAKFQPEDAGPLAEFLNHLRRHYWSLTSLAFQRRPDLIPLMTPAELIEENRRPTHLGTYLLKKEGRIISTMRLDDKFGDGRVLVVSGVETDPQYQRRGTFWRHLGEPLLRQICCQGFDRIEAVTWSFNRKGIPLYKRVGFRAVPGTSLILENYLPLIVRHPATRDYFARHDFIRYLENRRSYGYDGLQVGKLKLFAYDWKAGEEPLRVMIDWERKQIVSIQRNGWSAWCFVLEETPYSAYYCLENRKEEDLAYRLQVGSAQQHGVPLRRRLPAKQTITGHFRLSDCRGNPLEQIAVDIEIEGWQIPFRLHRSCASGQAPGWAHRQVG